MELIEIITRKPHKCAYCDNIIPKGEKAFYMEFREPVYDPDQYEAANGLNGKQTGIKYHKAWYRRNDKGICPSCANEDFNKEPIKVY